MKTYRFCITLCLISCALQNIYLDAAHNTPTSWLPDARTITRRAAEGALIAVGYQMTTAIVDRLFPQPLQRRPLSQTEKKLEAVRELYQQEEIELLKEKQQAIQQQRTLIKQEKALYQIRQDFNILGHDKVFKILSPEDSAQYKEKVKKDSIMCTQSINLQNTMMGDDIHE
jgi:hypothetical protein